MINNAPNSNLPLIHDPPSSSMKPMIIAKKPKVNRSNKENLPFEPSMDAVGSNSWTNLPTAPLNTTQELMEKEADHVSQMLWATLGVDPFGTMSHLITQHIREELKVVGRAVTESS